MKLIIHNKTDYLTGDLRRLFVRGLEAMGANMGKEIHVVPNRKRVRGRASMANNRNWQTNWILMKIPTNADPIRVARVFEHEVSHNLGVGHDEMHKDVLYCCQAVPWAEGLKLRTRATKPRLTGEQRQDQREARVRATLERWQKKLERAKRAVRKWTAKVRYYDRKKVAGGQTENSI